MLGYDGEPPPAPRMWAGVPRAPLGATLAEVLTTWAAAGTFPLVFASLSPFMELPVEGEAGTPGLGGAEVLRAAVASPATRETVAARPAARVTAAAAAVGVTARSASTGDGDGASSGHPLPRPSGVPDMESLTPTVVALVRRITQGADALGDVVESGNAGGGTTAAGATGHVPGGTAGARPFSHPSADGMVATARLLLRSLGAARIARCLGCRSTPTTLVGALPPPAGALVAAAAAPHSPPRRNGTAATSSPPSTPSTSAAAAAIATTTAPAVAGATPRPPRPPRPSPPTLTVAGRALMKHLGRRPPGWGTCYWGTEAASGGATRGGDGAKSAAAAAAVDRVLADAVWLNVHALPGGGQVVVVEARVPGGYGARWAWDTGGGEGRFRGFLEPHVLQPRPWEGEGGAAVGAPAGEAGGRDVVEDAAERAGGGR